MGHKLEQKPKNKDEGNVVAAPKSDQDSSGCNGDNNEVKVEPALESHPDLSPTVFQEGNPTNIPTADSYGVTKSSRSNQTVVQDRDNNTAKVEASLKSHQDASRSNPTVLQDGKPTNFPADKYEVTKSECEEFSNGKQNGSQPGAPAVESPDLNQKGNITSGDPANDKAALEKETSETKCVICDIYRPTRAAKCGHHFCKRCFNEDVRRKPLELMNPRLSCPKEKCTEILSEKEMYAYLDLENKTKWKSVKNYQYIKEMKTTFAAVSTTAKSCLSMIDRMPWSQ